MRIPTIAQAEVLLSEGGQMNPGPWTDHCKSTGQNARLIAAKCPGMDPDAALVLGMMHDIGRREGVTDIRHIWDGYLFMMERGWDDAAAICLTHSFPLQDVRSYFGPIDIPDSAYQFIRAFIDGREMTDYDRLIQLCDAISMPHGAVLMDKRLMDVALRRAPLPELSVEKWRANFALKDHFDALTGMNIYQLLPGIIENTFGY